MELERHLKHGQLPFFQRNIRNLYVKMRRNNAKNDAINLLQFCKVTKENNSRFQYAFTTDEENRLEHIFWSPTHCFDWYQKYGDVFVFYTTYKANVYDMPFGIFIGVNNHGKTILFGCALLRNETTSVFRWLMKVHSLSYKFVQLFFKFYLINLQNNYVYPLKYFHTLVNLYYTSEYYASILHFHFDNIMLVNIHIIIFNIMSFY